MKSQYVCLAGAIALAASGIFPAAASPVTATPGIIKGVVHFDAPLVPDSMEVDAQDATHMYNATAAAIQNDPVNCALNSQNWCYSVTVESALASSYYLRPIAHVSQSSPYVAALIPFPSTGPVSITSGATVTQDLPVGSPAYQPGEISGNLQVNDMSNTPLQLIGLFLDVNDLTNNQSLFQEGCGGSLDTCPYNSVYQSGGASTSLPYQLFLKPGEDYNYLTRGLDVAEGPSAKSAFTWDPNTHFGSLTAGQSVTANYTFNQKAQVTGNVQLALPVYNLEVDISGYTTTPGSFYDSYITNNQSGMPLLSPSYVGRIFDNADFSKTFNLSPLFNLSADGQTQLAYPPIPFNASSGESQVINFNDSPSSIAGRVTFNPPYPAGNVYPGIQAEALNSNGLGSSRTTLTPDAQGGTFLLPVFAGPWDYWRFGWNFNLGNPNFTSWYQVGQFLPINVPVATGQNVTGQTFTFGTAKVKVFFTAPTAPPNTTISDPQLDALSGHFVNGNFVLDAAANAHAAGLNQKNVTVGEADLVVRTDSNLGFQITPSAVINDGGTPGTGRTTFSPLILKPNQGDVIIVGVPGTLSLTVNTPVQGQVFSSCLIPVSGSATGTTNITITVNGKIVPTTPAGNPNDPNQVLFSTTVAGTGANTTITVVASAPNNTSVTDTIQVSAASAVVNTTAAVSTSMLWPPNHDMVNVGLSASATTACDANPTLGVKVYSNENETADTGDGPFSPDAKDIAPGTLELRSERMVTGNGRVYLIIATGSDHSGDTGTACTSVVVPLDQSAASVASVEAAASAAIATCKSTGLPPAGYMQDGLGPVIGPKQ